MASHAQSKEDAKNGLIFMQELLELMKNDKLSETSSDHPLPLSVIPLIDMPEKTLPRLTVASAQFGKQLYRTTGVRDFPSFEFQSFLRFRYLLWRRLFDRIQLVRRFSILLHFNLELALSIVVIVCLLKKLVI